MSQTPQDRGREWEHELARLVGGRVQVGSGNQVHIPLDVAGNTIIWSAKHTDALSFRISKAVIEEARMSVIGPAAGSQGRIDIIGYKLGDGTMRADLDLLELIAWLREPPQLLPATQQERLRHTARTPTLLRDDLS